MLSSHPSLPIPGESKHAVNTHRPYQYQEVEATNIATDITTYIHILKKRKWLILLPVVLILPFVLLLLLIKEPVYQASTTLLIEPGLSMVVKFDQVMNSGAYQDYYETQYRLIKSDPLLEKLIAAPVSAIPAPALPESEHQSWLKDTLTHLKEVVQGLKKRGMTLVQSIRETLVGAHNAPLPSPASLARWEQLKGLREAITVEPVEATRLVQLSIIGEDPYRITAQINTLAELYVAQNLERKLDVSKQASSWLQQEVQRLQASLQETEKALQQFIDTRGFVSTDLEKRQNIALAGFGELNSAYLTTQTQRLTIETQLNELRRLLQQPLERRQSLALSVSTPVIETLQKRYVELENQIANLSEMYKEKHPRIMTLEAEKKQIKDKIEVEIKTSMGNTESEYRSILSKEKELEILLKKAKSDISNFDKDMVGYISLKSSLDSKRTLYEEMLRRLNETDLTKGLETNNLQIVQQASVPIGPVPAKPHVKFLASLGLTLGMGIGLAFLAEVLDKRFKNPLEAEQVLRLPFLGLIPHYRIDKRDRHTSLQPWQSARSPVADAYRNIRTNLQFFAAQKPLRSLLLTSAAPEEGKSTTVTNLGIAFAQLGKTVLLVDGDLRRPTLHRFFHLPNERGLSDVLIHSAPWHALLQQTAIENLQVLTSGPIPYNPIELLSTTRMQTLIAHLKEAFDIVIYEAPMMLSTSDAAVFAAAMDGVILVHNPRRSQKEVVTAAKQTLERAHANLVGLIFNDVDVSHIHGGTSVKYYYGDEPVSGNKPMIIGISSNAEPSTPIPSMPPAQQSQPMGTTPLVIGKTHFSQGLVVTIHHMRLDTALSQPETDSEYLFLVLDLEVSNTLDVPHTFHTTAIILFLRHINPYSRALSKMYSSLYENGTARDTGLFSPDHITHDIAHGLPVQVPLPAHQSKRGLVVFRISQASEHYTFTYEHDDVHIIVPFG